MRRFLFDYIYNQTKKIVTNELICCGLDDAIDFIDQHFIELHAEGETEISAIQLRDNSDEPILIYEMQTDFGSGHR